MNKGVGKKILALLLSVCMVLSLTDFSTLRVEAAITLTTSNITVTFALDSDGDGNNDVNTTRVEYMNGTEGARPAVESVVYSDGTNTTTLTASADYKVTYSNWQNYGDEAMCIITGNGGYTGTVTVYYSIYRKDLSGNTTDGGPITVTFNDAYSTSDTGIPQYQYTGNSVTPGFSVVDTASGTTMDSDDYSYSWQNNTNAGKSTDATKPALIITGKGNYSGTYYAYFNILAVATFTDTNTVINLAQTSYAYDGTQKQPAVTSIVYTDEDGSDHTLINTDTTTYYTVSWTQNVNPGNSAKVTVTGTGDYAGSASTTFTITRSMRDMTITDSTTGSNYGSYTYTGSAIQPIAKTDSNDGTITVKDPLTGATLTEGVDYTISYGGDNVNVIERGLSNTPYITITPVSGGIYTDSKTMYYAITKRNVNTLTITIKDNAGTDWIYNGEEIPPTATLSSYISIWYDADGDGTCDTSTGDIVYDLTDFDVAVTDNVNAGTATVTATAKSGDANWTGSTSNTFTINAKSLKTAGISASFSGASDYTYSGAAIKPEVLVVDSQGTTDTSDDVTLTLGTDYTVDYKNNTNASDASDATAPPTVVITGIGNYKDQITITFTINPRDMEAHPDYYITSVANATYKGSAVEPAVTVYYDEDVTTAGDTSLVKGTDFTVTYSNNIDASDNAKLVITGIGNYKGTIEKTFTIQPRAITNLTLTIADIPYNSSAATYDPSLSDITAIDRAISSTDVVNQANYEIVSCSDDTAMGYQTASCTIQGKNNYTGTTTVKYSIKRSINDSDVTVTVPDAVYTGSSITPTITIQDDTFTNFSIDNSEVTYTFTEENADTVNVTHQLAMTITVKSSSKHFMGSTTAYFKIVPKLLSEDDITIVSAGDFEYTGTGIQPTDITVKYGDVKLTENEDYTIQTYNNNVDLSVSGESDQNPQIVIASAGANYTGEQTLKNAFNIVQRNLETGTFDLTGFDDKLPFVTAGSEVKQDITNFAFTATDGTVFSNLIEGEDFTVSYKNNTLIGKATMTITGIGNFTGSQSFNYWVQGDISNATIGDITAVEYTTSAITPTPVITYVYGSIYGTAVLTAGSELADDDADFYYTYNNNTDAGEDTATVTIHGKDTSYTGTQTKTFTILKKDLTPADGETTAENITIQDGTFSEEMEYTGSVIKQDGIVLKNFDTVMGSENTDYNIKYYLNDSETEATDEELTNITDDDSYIRMVITGDENNYTGTMELKYKIVPRNIENGTVTIDSLPVGVNWADYDYGTVELAFDGDSALGVTFTSTDNVFVDSVLNFTDDFTVDYSANTNIGLATVILTGTGNYQGSVDFTFKIMGSLETDEALTTMNEIPDQEYTGGDITPEIELAYNGNTLVQGTDYTVNVTNAKEVGTATATITGNSEGYYFGTRVVYFNVVPKDLDKARQDDSDITVEEDLSMMYTGSEVSPLLAIYNHGNLMTEGTDYTIDYGEYEDNINVGEKTATITGMLPNYKGTMTITFSILPRDLGENDGSYTTIAAIPTQSYTGAQITPTGLTVTYAKGSVVFNSTTNPIVEGMDYSIAYGENIAVGEGSVTITGTGNFTGSVTRTFTIAAKDISSTSVETKVTVEAASYTGSAVEPGVTVVVDGVTLTEDDYTITGYSNNTAPSSEAVVTIQGKGNYTGTVSTKFTISGKKITDAAVKIAAIAAQTYCGSAIEPDVSMTEDGTALVKDTDYTLSYTNNVNVGTATVTITGKGYYSGTRTTTFTIGKKSLADADVTIAAIANQTYTGKALTPAITVTYVDASTQKSYTLKLGTDYSISYSSNTAIGTGKVTITGLGNYANGKTASFKIVGNLSGATVSTIASQPYTGSSITPAVTLKFGSTTLKAGTDYTVAYTNNIEVGTAKVTFTAVAGSSYIGTKTATFTISEPIADSMVISGIASAGYTYTKSAIKPTIKVMFGDTVLKNGTDYTVSYSNNKNVGTGKLTVTAKGSYSGSKTVTFKIVKRSLSLATASSIANQTYTGSTIKPTVTIKDGSTKLVKSTDYTVVYASNKKPGTATVIVSGRGNYTGTKVLHFKITVSKPTSFKASSITTSSMKLSWSLSGKATGYEIYDTNNKLVKKTTSKSYTVTGLKAGTTYKYKVRSYTISSGSITYSSFTSVLTTTTKPATPVITLSSSKTKQVVVKWKKISGATGYEIYRSTSKSGTYKKVTTITKGSTVSYTNKSLSSKKTYYYKVRAYKTLNKTKVYGSYSTIKSVKTK